MKIVEIFDEVPDFRTKSYITYSLSEILIISLCAVLSGAEDFEEISEYGGQKEPFLKQFLELKNGIASADTIRRVFQHLDVKAFEKLLTTQSKPILEQLEFFQINIDGKVMRATGQRGKKTAALCIVSAWVSEHCLSLGQVKVNKKSNEKTAIPEINKSIDIRGALVSIDAMGCHSSFANLIREYLGDYLLALKKNQKSLYEEVHDWMIKHKDTMDCHSHTDYVGGRIEKRTTYVTNNLTYIDALAEWKDCKTIIMNQNERSFKNGMQKNTTHTRFFVSSFDKDAAFLGSAIRNHWSIENQLYWYLDVVFNEDNQRVREGNAPENMATLRKMGLQSLLKHKGKGSLKRARKKAGWNEDFLLDVLKSF
jgi:predicted transposase YbfD/YdcC